MTIKKLSPAVQVAVANTLTTYVNAQIDAISAVWNDGVPLPHVAQVYNGYREMVPEYPVILVSSRGGKQRTNGATVWAEIDHRLDVSILVQCDDEPTLDQQMQRYLVAIWEVLMVNQGLDGSLSGLAGVDPVEYGRSGMYKLEKSTLLMEAGGWSIVVHVVESV